MGRALFQGVWFGFWSGAALFFNCMGRGALFIASGFDALAHIWEKTDDQQTD